jgi:hypothetical protein
MGGIFIGVVIFSLGEPPTKSRKPDEFGQFPRRRSRAHRPPVGAACP